jgi:hypothetical protein
VLRFRRRLIAWIVLAIGVPLVAEGLHRAADSVEARRGVTPAARGLRIAGRMAEGMRRPRRRWL